MADRQGIRAVQSADASHPNEWVSSQTDLVRDGMIRAPVRYLDSFGCTKQPLGKGGSY